MLREILEATQLDPSFCAELVRVSPDQFSDWMEQKRPVPGFILPELASILGVPENAINSSRALGEEPPAIWFKLRNSKLKDADREFVGFVRKFGYYLGQLKTLTGRATQYEHVFAQVRKSIDRSSYPATQGRVAAKSFRESTGLDQGQSGIGDVLRPHLRALGILLIESPLPKSDIDGCCFGLGTGADGAPCIFSNTYKSSWFRRNYVIAHELCHAIFDLDNEQVSLDYKSEYSDQYGRASTIDISELRAQVFAEECVIPKTVLVALANQIGIHWNALSVENLAFLVAKSHVEQGMVLRAAKRSGLIDEEQFKTYYAYDCAAYVKQFTDHALSTREYLKKMSMESPKWKAENRRASIGSRTLRLPVGYIQQVLEALKDSHISEGKAAEMLMIDKDVLRQRFSLQ
jgi:Zn-dependent peptidase ImmA (M78 family)